MKVRTSDADGNSVRYLMMRRTGSARRQQRQAQVGVANNQRHWRSLLLVLRPVAHHA